MPSEEIYRMDAMESVLPRLSYAMQTATARAELVQALMEENGTISPASLALLCDVVYTYIIKVIRAKTLEATKINRQWHIPAKVAAEFLRDYAYPVDTIMKKIRESNTNYKY